MAGRGGDLADAGDEGSEKPRVRGGRLQVMDLTITSFCLGRAPVLFLFPIIFVAILVVHTGVVILLPLVVEIPLATAQPPRHVFKFPLWF
jgi:hypothetical protein